MTNLKAALVAYFTDPSKLRIASWITALAAITILVIGPIAIYTYFASTLGLVELAGTVFSAICVYLAIKHNQWTWFFGALGVLLFGYLFLQYALISDAALQILFFLPMQVIGFFWWRNQACKADNAMVVKAMSTSTFVSIGVLIAILTVGNGWLMATYGMEILAWINAFTSQIGMVFPVVAASFPYADAFTTWMSVAAQLLMVAKFRESWVLWVTMDIAAIFIYFAKGLIVVSGLYVLFLVLATLGGIAWYKNYKDQQAEEDQRLVFSA